jgi:predicted ribosome quality control (RQC) complex YloA/Tae2 family protein
MPFDSFVLGAVAEEIRETAIPSQVQKIYQPSELETIFHLRCGGERRLLLFSADPHRFRMHFVQDAPENPPAPPQFCMVLRKHLEGAKLVKAEQPGLERILRLTFSRSDGERTLIAEMMGKRSNLILLDERGIILDSIKRISARVNRVREILPNRPYLPPPPGHFDPSLASLPELEAALEGVEGALTPAKLMKAASNVGPLAAAEILARSETPNPADVARALAETVSRMRGEFEPTLLLDAEGKPTDAWAFELKSFPEERQDSAPSMSLALEIAESRRSVLADIDQLREEARRKFLAWAEREERKIEEIGAAISQAERSEEHRIAGELIQANVSLLERGQSEADLPNYYDPELKTMRVTLDPTLSPQENAEAYFRRHRKGKAGLPLLVSRREEAERSREKWSGLAAEAETASEARLREMLAETSAASDAPLRAGDSPEAARRPAPGVRRALSSDGYEIWYGDNQEGNDTLTTRLASPSDIWLHVRAGASAHVVIRAGKRPEAVPYRTIQEAARIAVAHSDSKSAGLTPVDYTLKKYVRKPKGSGPGKAFYSREKTLHIEND